MIFRNLELGELEKLIAQRLNRGVLNFTTKQVFVRLFHDLLIPSYLHKALIYPINQSIVNV